jgi:hypothetical protein
MTKKELTESLLKEYRKSKESSKKGFNEGFRDFLIEKIIQLKKEMEPVKFGECNCMDPDCDLHRESI